MDKIEEEAHNLIALLGIVKSDKSEFKKENHRAAMISAFQIYVALSESLNQP
jgi:hypothetical protein